MWLINSSIGRKVVMSVTGIALILFLTFHASMNVVALISRDGYNMICEFLGANWYAVVATIGLAGLVALHFIFAFWLTIQNQKARGNSKYAVTSKPEKVEWASQNMLVLGIIVILGMVLHLYNFWWNMMATDLGMNAGNGIGAVDGVGQIKAVFANPVYTVLYLVWLVALWFHLTHGFWSALQTMGWNGKVWFCRWKCIGTIFSTIIVLMFAAVAIAFACGYAPCDKKCCDKQACEQVEKSCQCADCQCEDCQCDCQCENGSCAEMCGENACGQQCGSCENACCAEAADSITDGGHNHADRMIHAGECPACPSVEDAPGQEE